MARFLGSASRGRRAGTLGLTALLTAASLGCQRASEPSKAALGIEPAYNKATGRLERIAYDRNNDGKPDAWLVMQGTGVVSAELDENFDGVVDRKEFYANGPAGVQPVAGAGALPLRSELTRAEQSTGGDGTMNRFETYKGGRVVRVEEDANGDGRIDKWETWSGGVLQMVALDTKGRGQPDRRLVYPADGSGPLMEIDAAGNGTFTPVAAGH